MNPGVIFDLDGILIDSEELHYQAYCQVLAAHDVSIDRTLYAREWIATGRGPDYAVETFELPYSAAEFKRRKQPVYHELLQSELRAMPGAAAALARLGKDFPLAVATNSGRADVDFVLGQLGMLDFFEQVITRERYERAKPEPDAFLAAASALERSPDRCVVIEDSRRGVRAAVAAEIACIAVPNDFTRDSDLSDATKIVPDLDAIDSDLIHEIVG